jgi:uncharacterized membrane protein
LSAPSVLAKVRVEACTPQTPWQQLVKQLVSHFQALLRLLQLIAVAMLSQFNLELPL